MEHDRSQLDEIAPDGWSLRHHGAESLDSGDEVLSSATWVRDLDRNGHVEVAIYPDEGVVFASIRQRVKCDGYASTLSIWDLMLEENSILERLETLFSDIENGEHLVTPVDAQQWDDGVDFACVYDRDLPDAVDPELLSSVVSTDGATPDFDDRGEVRALSPETLESMSNEPDNVVVHVFPKLWPEVEDTEGGIVA